MRIAARPDEAVPGAGRSTCPDDEYSSLMERHQAGDARALEALYAALSPDVEAYLNELLPGGRRDPSIVEEVFLTIHRARRSYDPKRPFGPWVRAIARHVALDRRPAWCRHRYRAAILGLLALLALLALFAPLVPSPQAAQRQRFEDLTGPYLGQKPPGLTPAVFAPGLVSTGAFERDVAITPEGREIYFSMVGPGYAHSGVVVTRLVDGHWTEPEIVRGFEDPRDMSLEPALAADGNTLFFLSNRPDPASGGKAGNQDIWAITRGVGGWSEPRNLGAPINSALPEYFPSATRDGTLYFTREETGGLGAIWRARRADGRYQQPEKLPAQVNSGRSQFNAFVAPDESYVIVPVQGRADSVGGCDYYVVFRESDDRWSEPINLGPAVNTAGSQEYSPYVSPDGRYFFFMTSRLLRPERLTYRVLCEWHDRAGNGNPDIWWVDASVVTSLRARAVFAEKRAR